MGEGGRGAVDARRERAAEALLDDERLRGGLTDDVYAPLLDWALGWVDAYAGATAGLEDQAARAATADGVAWTKAQLGALVGVLERWADRPRPARADALARLAPSFPAPRLAARRERLSGLDDPAAAAAAIAAALPEAPRD